MKSPMNIAVLSPAALAEVRDSLLVLKTVPYVETNRQRVLDEIRRVERILLDAVRTAGRNQPDQN